MFENPRRVKQARNFTKNVPKIVDLKSSSEQIFPKIDVDGPWLQKSDVQISATTTDTRTGYGLPVLTLAQLCFLFWTECTSFNSANLGIGWVQNACTQRSINCTLVCSILCRKYIYIYIIMLMINLNFVISSYIYIKNFFGKLTFQ